MSMVETKPTAAPANVVSMAQTPWQMSADIYSSPAAFEHAQRVATAFSKSVMVPEHLRKNGMADVLAALGLARAMNAHPLLVMQSIFFIGGKAGWATQFMIARANQAGVFKGRITWKTEGAGKEMSVTAKAVLADTGEEVTAPVSMQMAMAEGWTKNAKYTSMPEHMLRWRSAAMLIRLYCPEVMFGLPTVEEIETTEMRDVTPDAPRSLAAALDAFASAPDPQPIDGEVTAAGPILVDAQQRAEDGDVIDAGDKTERAAHVALRDKLYETAMEMPDVEQLDGFVGSVDEQIAGLPDDLAKALNGAIGAQRTKLMKGRK